MEKTILSDPDKQWTSEDAISLVVYFITHYDITLITSYKEKYEANNKQFINDDIAFALANEYVITQYVLDEFSKAGKDTVSSQEVLDMMDYVKYNGYINENEEKIEKDTSHVIF